MKNTYLQSTAKPCNPKLMFSPLLLAAVLLAQTSAIDAAPETVGDELRRAINEYHYGNYESAIEQLRGLLYPMRLNAEADTIQARQFLALSYYLTEQPDNVREEFAKLLFISPDFKLDPFAVPPPIIEVFESLRKQLKAELDLVRARQQSQVKTPKRGLTLRTVERTVVEKSQVATLLPFGAGQFQNGNAALGTALLITELCLLGINIGAYLYSLSLDDFDETQRATVERTTLVQYGALALFGVSWSLGVFEARLNFVPRYANPPKITEQNLSTQGGLGGILQFGLTF